MANSMNIQRTEDTNAARTKGVKQNRQSDIEAHREMRRALTQSRNASTAADWETEPFWFEVN